MTGPFEVSINYVSLASGVGLLSAYLFSLYHYGRKQARYIGRTYSKRGYLSLYSTKTQRRRFTLGVVVLVLLTNYPIENLARLYSVTAYLGQNLLIMLVAVPLMLLGLPRWLVVKLTRHRSTDLILTHATRPILSTFIFSSSIVASMLSSIVTEQSKNTLFRTSLHAELIAAGAVMWIAALGLMPGVRQMSTMGRVIYLFAQSLIPSFPAFVLIFARHSFYPVYAAHISALGISAVADQELAGGLSKLISLGILWGTSIAIVIRANRYEEIGADPEPLTMDDLEREFTRSERKPKDQG